MASFRTYLYSNSKLLALYFVGTFLLLLVVSIFQQGWYQFTETDFYEKYFVERLEGDGFKDQSGLDDLVGDGQSLLPKNEFIIEPGESFRSVLNNLEIPSNEIVEITKIFSTVFDMKKLRVGTKISVEFVENLPKDQIKIKELTVHVSNTKKIKLFLNHKKSYEIKVLEIPLVKKTERSSGTITNSFIATANKMQLSNQSIMEMVKAYSYELDFQRDIKYGNKLEVLVDKYYTEDGKFDHSGDVLYAKIELVGKAMEIFLFENPAGDFSYYTADAVSVRRDFLRTPINAAKISSGFGMRKHPVLGYSRMHKGVDFAAPIGTPVLAAGSGVVILVGRKGGYGKYIRIKHNDTFSTAYAHLSRFSKDIKKGSKIKQGQVIGYVGNTGITSGPHLHFEVIKFDRQVNPNTIKAAPETKLKGKSLHKFNEMKSKILKNFKSAPAK